jgi:hypothetical protein
VVLVVLVVVDDLMIVVLQVEKEIKYLTIQVLIQVHNLKEMMVDLLQLVHLLTLVEVVEVPVVLV